MSTYDDSVQRPLFGEPRRRDRFVNLVVGVLACLAVAVTLISAFVFPRWPPNGVNVFFAIIMVFIGSAHVLLIYWYRQGDLEPKFRTLIYFNAFTITLLCICGNLYIHEVGMTKSGGGGNSTSSLHVHK